MSDEMDAFLEHHGVLGMHWGSRRAVSNRPVVSVPRVGQSSKSKKASDFVRGHKAEIATAGVVTANIAARAIMKQAFTTSVKHAANAENAARAARFAGRMVTDGGKSLPYAKILKGAYKVTSLR